MSRIFLLSFFAMLSFQAQLTAQETVRGTVTNQEDVILPGAQVWLEGYEQQASTVNAFGDFLLPWPAGEGSRRLFTRFVGHRPDTLLLGGPGYRHIRLFSDAYLETVVVSGRREGQFISAIAPVKTEVISQAELAKGACCDLAGCFNTNGTVQAATTNIVTNAKELRILGLGGVYNQVLLDGFPLFQALAYTYGMGTLPGPLVRNIHISKGANSVLQGWDGISGQINVEVVEPEGGRRGFVNGYMNSFGEKQANAYIELPMGGGGNLLALHTVQPASRLDRDGDRFLDMPLVTRYSLLDRFRFGAEDKPGPSVRGGFRFVSEDRLGGQSDFRSDRDEGSRSVYGQRVRFLQLDAWAKVAWRIDADRRVVSFLSGQWHDQDSWYGILRYRGEQRAAQAIVQYEHRSASGNDLKAGIGYRQLQVDEDLDFGADNAAWPQAGRHERVDRIPGIFAERIAYHFDGRLTWILGARADHHQVFGWQFTPRTMLKFDPVAGSSLRGSAGWGWRMANVFSENVFLLASNRRVFLEETLRPEKALNWGINYTHTFPFEEGSLRLGADYYETRFSNQIFPDYDRSPVEAYVGNFGGTSMSRALQADADFSLQSGWQAKLAYNFVDVYQEAADGTKRQLPFNANHRLLAVISFSPPGGRWQADMNWHGYGRQRLPDTSGNPEEFRRPDRSEPYSLTTAQFTWRFRIWELYGGCENIFDFRQERPILGWQDPFGPYFDTSSAWGPTRGREFYLGFRLRLGGAEAKG